MAAVLTTLDEAECLRLLAGHEVGRIAIALDGDPLVVPVTYALDGRSVVFRTEVGGLLDALLAGGRAVLEVDELAHAVHGGWSVLAAGPVAVVDDPVETGRLDALPLRSWAQGAKARHLRLVPDRVTGRRLPFGRPADAPVQVCLSSEDAIAVVVDRETGRR